MTEGNKIQIRQVRSGVGCPEKQKKVLRGLGFKRLNQVVERPDNPGIRGMIFKVRHLVEVLDGPASPVRAERVGHESE